MENPLLSDLFAALDVAVIERLPTQLFSMLAENPKWFHAVLKAAPDMGVGSLAGVLPFLDHFLREADIFWRESHRAPDDSGRVRLNMRVPDFGETPSPEALAKWRRQMQEATSINSGPFVATVGAEELLLSATAMTLTGRMILIIEKLTGDADMRPILQKAREQALDREQLARLVDAVHAPVTSIADNLAQLAATTLSPAQQQIVDRLVGANARLQTVAASRPAPVQRGRRSTTGAKPS